jgi:hypothetical protein
VLRKGSLGSHLYLYIYIDIDTWYANAGLYERGLLLVNLLADELALGTLQYQLGWGFICM